MEPQLPQPHKDLDGLRSNDGRRGKMIVLAAALLVAVAAALWAVIYGTWMRSIVRRYLSRDIADAILDDHTRRHLGGDSADVTILFADLGGYTTYSEHRTPQEVVELLNARFAVAVPAILADGGTPVQLPGDAVVTVFGAPRAVADHARRAAHAALVIQDRTRQRQDRHHGWPLFRIGLNSGEALVGNIGSAEYRNFTAVGDTVNMAQRLQTLAEPGQVVVGADTAALLGDSAEMTILEPAAVKGRAEPARPRILHSVAGV